MGRDTGVCNCTPALGEHCKRCDAVPDLKEEDRNYHEEMLLILRDMESTSRQPEAYSILRTLYELDDEKSFNTAVREIIDNVKKVSEMDWCEDDKTAMGEAFAAYHKTLRQYDHYNHLSIWNEEKKDYESTGCFQSILYDLIHISEVPYNMIKKLLSL
jgi:hypothetical protein